MVIGVGEGDVGRVGGGFWLLGVGGELFFVLGG